LRDVVCLFLAFLCIFSFVTVSVHAADSDDSELEYVDPPEDVYMPDGLDFDVLEGDEPEALYSYDFSEMSDQQRDFYDRLYDLLDERLPLGISGDDYIEPPPLHELLDTGGISFMSIGTQAAYPYTGGAFMAVNTNYGNGLIVTPEPFKVNTFGFLKNTNRVVNLTNSTVSGYWIMGGTTYNLQFSRYGEAQYQYYTGSTYTWRTLTISALTDSNVQFLDETGERGIQRPYLTLQDKILLLFVFAELAIHGLALIRRR
jgi:hypothetical protein